MSDEKRPGPSLLRELGAWDCALLTFGNVVGSAIFFAASVVPKALPHAGLVVLVWLAGGILSLAGVLTYFVSLGVPAYAWWRSHPRTAAAGIAS